MKIEEYVCSREQMKELQKLGFDTDKASMAWLGFDEDDWMVAIHNDNCYELTSQTCVPTFSVAEMLEILPSRIHIKQHMCNFEAAFVYQSELNSKFIKAIKREDFTLFQIKDFASKLLKIRQMRLPYNYFN